LVNIADFEKVYANRHTLAWQWKQEGRKIFGYVYSLTPEELLYAADIIPVQLTEGEDSEDLRRGKVDMPETFCSYSLSLAGQGAAGVYQYLDGVIFTEACSQIKTSYEVWTERFVPPFFEFMYVPDEHEEGTIKFYTACLRDLKKRLEAFLGREITDEALRQAVDVYNENRRLVKRLYETRLVDTPPISGSQIFEVMKAGLVMPKDQHNSMLKKLLAEIEKQEPEPKKNKPRIMAFAHIFEECNGKVYPNFIRMMEELGGNVVYDELFWGGRYYDAEVAVQGDVLEALADRYAGQVPHPSKYFTKNRVKYLLEGVEKYRVNGIVFFLPKYCQPYWFQQYLVEKALKEKDIPFLTVETVAGMPEASVRTRLEAFIEMIG